MTDFVDKLRAIVGDKGLIIDNSGKHPYLTDWRDNYLGAALAVVRPATTEEVAAVVKLCAAEKVAIVPQGGNTGMIGGRHAAPERPRDRAVAQPHEPHRRYRPDRLLDDGRGGRGAEDHPGDRRPARPAVSPEPGRRRKLHDRRQPLDQRRRRAGPALRQRPPTRARPRGGDAPGRDLERPARAQEGQYRLRPARPLSRRRRHPGHRHQGGAEALAQAQGRGDRVDRRALARSRGRASGRRLCRAARTMSPPAS